MNRDCITSNQGRAPCTCGLHTANSDGSDPNQAWEWIDEIKPTLRWLALGIIGAFTVLLMTGFSNLN